MLDPESLNGQYMGPFGNSYYIHRLGSDGDGGAFQAAKKLDCGPGAIYAGFPSSLGFGVGGQ